MSSKGKHEEENETVHDSDELFTFLTGFLSGSKGVRSK